MTGAPTNLGTIFADHVAGTRVAAIDLSRAASPREVNYASLDAACNAAARGLLRKGFGKGDRIAVLALNRIEYLEVLFGAMRAGIVPVPLNVKLAPDLIRGIILDAGVRLVFADPDLAHLCPAGVERVLFDADHEGYRAFLDPGPFRAIETDPTVVAIQPYTSGSTGPPKGVLLNHAGQLWVHRAGRWMKPDDSYIVAAPLYHKNALMTVKAVLLAGARMVLLPRFEANRYIESIARYHPHALSGVPAMFAMILRDRNILARVDTSSVRQISIGSAPASKRLLDQLDAVFRHPTVTLHYGITEGGPRVFGAHPQGLPRPRGSVGYPLRDGEVTLVGGPNADQGVLWVRNPGVMLGYHNRPAMTAERLKDGWFITGDILRRDAQGFYYVVGRADDMFICGGENIFPHEVETLLEKHDDIVQAAVVPVDDEIKGQVPYAFVVKLAGADLSEEELKSFVLAHGPAYLHPRRIFFMDALPLASTNKVDRHALEAMADAAPRAAK